MPTIDFIMRCIIFIFSLVGVFLFWYGLVFIIGRLSKWTKLSNAYPNTDDQMLECKKYIYLKINSFANYNGIVSLEATRKGLRMKIFFLFKAGHKPIHIPWSELNCIKRNDDALTSFFFFTYFFTTAKLPNVKLSFKKKVGQWILEEQKKYLSFR